MPTVIDSLLVTLGLDSTAFKKGSKDVEEAQKKLGKQAKRQSKEREQEQKKAGKAQSERAKQLQRQGKQAMETYKKIRNQVLSLGLAFTAGMGFSKFAEWVVGDTSAMGRLGDVAGMSAREISGWGLAAKNAGGSAKEMMQTILKASNEVAGFHLGHASEGIKAFLAFGGDKNALKNAKSYLLGVSDLLERINKTNPARAQMVAGQMGFDFNAFNVLKQGPSALQKNIAAYEKLTGVTREQRAESQKALEQWNAMTASLENTGRMVMLNLMPAFHEVMKEVQKLSLWMASHKDDVRQWGVEGAHAVKEFAKAVGQLISFLNRIDPYLEKIKPILKFANALTLPAFAQMKRPQSWGAEAGGWLRSLFGLQSGAGAGRVSNHSVSSSHVQSETHINQIIINTQATDATGIASDMWNAVKANPMSAQSNSGMN